MIKGDRIRKKITIHIIMAIICCAYLMPTFITINYAFKDQHARFYTSPLQLPTQFYFQNFISAVVKLKYFRTLTNTFIITALAVAAIIVFSGMVGYALARNLGKRKWYKGIYFYFLIGILVPYQAIFVPLYLVGKSMGFVNNLFGVVFLYVATSLPFAVFMMTSFMNTIPVQMDEAAIIDGCSVLRTYINIILPLLKPIAATLAIIQSFSIWNDFLMPFLFLQKTGLKTLTVMQKCLFEQYRADYGTAFAGIIISGLPIIIFFVFFQKYFIKGITIGAVKG